MSSDEVLKNKELKALVARGYDQIAERYADWATETRIAERARYTALLCEQLPSGARVLELGCGAGGTTTEALAARFSLTGVDISGRHIELARQRVPGATFINADMTSLDFPPESFDAVTAFYSIIHVPRAEQPGLLRSIASWLRPGGLLVVSLSVYDDAGSVEQDWLGAPMYWSGFDGATNRTLVQQAGLALVSATEETAEEDGEAVSFLWVVARKP